ncbi:MAG: hypothetical protein M5U28_38070 [Sandaracinaceae bacterium]|nr:hypothetical protein [Sandaracinaceae bacterium]
MTASDASIAASSCITRAYAVALSPKPPCSSGMVSPKRPISFILARRPSGIACSRSMAAESTSVSPKRRTFSRTSERLSLSSGFISG